MAGIERIVTVNINLDTASVARKSFDKLLLVDTFTLTGRVIEITSADDLLLTTSYGLTSGSALYKAAQVAFSQIPAPTSIFIGKRTANEDPAVAMAAIRNENDDWYAFSDVSRDVTETDHLDFAAWAEANEKLFVTSLAQAQVATIGAAFKTGSYFRTGWWQATDPLVAFPDVAATVKAFSRLPGGDNWANMTLAAVPAVKLTETEAGAVFAQNGNTFESFRNSVSITQGGKVAAGEWIDTIRGRDWLAEEIKVNVFDHFVDNKRPYTDAGIQGVGQQVRRALDLGVERGIIAPPELALDGKTVIPSYTLTLPRSSGISDSQKATRRLIGLGFNARIAGSINFAAIGGTLSYSLTA